MSLTGQHPLSYMNSTSPVSQNNCLERSDEYVFKIAESGRELIKAFHLLYNEYRRAEYVPESPSELLFTRYHLLPETTIFLAMSQDKALSTATVIRDSKRFGLPMDDIFKEELDGLRISRRKILEVSSLASDRSMFSRDRVRHFITMVYAHSLFLDVDDICIMVNPRHVRLYRTLFAFENFGEERHYPRVNAPGVALRVDVHDARRKFGNDRSTAGLHSTCLADTYSSRGITISGRMRKTFEGCPEKGRPWNPLDAGLANHILSEKTTELKSLPPQWREFLDNLYPTACLNPS